MIIHLLRFKYTHLCKRLPLYVYPFIHD